MARAPQRSERMITVYGYSPSGNCYKLRMLLEPARPRIIAGSRSTAPHGATRTPEYLAKNPNGKVPMIETRRRPRAGRIERDPVLARRRHAVLPGDAWQRAQTLPWMFFEQYSHEPYVAVARFICGWTPVDSPRRAELPRLRERGDQALGVMEKHLASNAWFSATGYGIADIALFGYTHCADDGGFELARYPHIVAWLDRVRAQPGFVPMAAYAAENVALIEQSPNCVVTSQSVPAFAERRSLTIERRHLRTRFPPATRASTAPRSCDQNFIEFVEGWHGETRRAPRADEPVLPGSLLHRAAISPSCSNRS